MFRLNLPKIAAVATLSLAASATGFADLYYVGDTAPNASLAGGGVWDNATANWSSATGGPADSTWSAGGNAVFQGTAGGTVNTTDDLTIGSATFTSGAGSFTITNANNVTFSGAGLANNSGITQSYSNFGNTYFTNSSSASGGSGAMSIDNSGTLYFQDTATGGSANLTNEAFATVDISNLSSAGTSIAALNNQGYVTLFTKHLAVNDLTLGSGSEFDFTLGTTSGEVFANTSLNETAPITIDVRAGAGFGVGTYTLIDFNGASGDNNFNLADYALGAQPDGYTVSLQQDGNSLVLVAVVPEVSSFVIPILGAAGLFYLRRRRSAMSVEAFA